MRAIDHVGLTVADLDRAVEFWCGRLGLRLLGRVTETGPDIASLLGEDSVELEIADLDAGDGRIIELIRYIRPAGQPARGSERRSWQLPHRAAGGGPRRHAGTHPGLASAPDIAPPRGAA
jgi:catechol 2,3-dioxygenase-like lactoylglutathione lyase family enzyme